MYEIYDRFFGIVSEDTIKDIWKRPQESLKWTSKPCNYNTSTHDLQALKWGLVPQHLWKIDFFEHM